MSSEPTGAYGADHDIVDYILGITYEIWEQGGIDLIHQYYSQDCVVWGLDGITHGAAAVVDGTLATLGGFPDRLLIGEDVIWSGDRSSGYYTSHRLLSLATNKGPSNYGPATNRRIRMTNIADCVIEDGVIVREWLVRDNMTLAEQLGADPIAAAEAMAAGRNQEFDDWIRDERSRVQATDLPPFVGPGASPADDPTGFAWRVLASAWRGDQREFDACHAPYSVMHRSPLRQYSGREEIFAYYQQLRHILGDVSFSVDHVASQPFSNNGVDIAIRWTVAGTHKSGMYGVAATDKDLFIMGVTHWHCIDGRIASEATIFDDLALLSQTMVD
jgi:predicted ester cyclase